MVKIRPLT